MSATKPATEINIVTTAPDGTFKFDFKPVCEATKEEVLDLCKRLGFEADALALHWFDNELDSLTEWQAMRIYWNLRVCRNNQKGEPHFVTCISCSHDFTCSCSDLDHREGKCGPCHEGVTYPSEPSRAYLKLPRIVVN